MNGHCLAAKASIAFASLRGGPGRGTRRQKARSKVLEDAKGGALVATITMVYRYNNTVCR